jgi:hypothetical protein
MKALSITIQKIWPMLKFLQTDRQTDQKLYAPDLSTRRAHSYFFGVTKTTTNY